MRAGGRLEDLARRVTGRGEPRRSQADRVASLEVAVAENNRLGAKLGRQVHELEQSCLVLLQETADRPARRPTGMSDS